MPGEWIQHITRKGNAFACVLRDSLSAGGADTRMTSRCQSHGGLQKKPCKAQEDIIQGSIAGTSLAFEDQKKSPVGKSRCHVSKVEIS